MKRTISSTAQSAFKMLALVFVVLFLCMMLSTSLDTGRVAWSFIAMPGVVLAAFLIFAASRKTVQVDERFLYISTFRKVTQVPLEQIESVREAIRLNDRVVTVHFRSATPVGRSIRFTPKAIFSWKPHPIVRELQALAGRESRGS